MFASIGTLFVGIFVGLYTYQFLADFFKFDEKTYDKAIRDHFGCQKNDFTFFHSGEDDFYIATVDGKEYEVKFSDNKPRKIIYCEPTKAIVEDL